MQGNFPGMMHASFIDVMLPSDVPIKVELIHDNYMRLWDDFVGKKCIYDLTSSKSLYCHELKIFMLSLNMEELFP